MKTHQTQEIELCMGSSCYSRGNAETLQAVQNFAEASGLDDSMYLKGCLCAGLCKNGPIVRINGETFTRMDAEKTVTLLRNRTRG